LSRFPRAFALSDPPRYDQLPSEALTERAAAAGVPTIDLAYDVVASGGIVYVPISNYVDANGEQGFFQLRHRVYARESKPCLTCKTPIKRIVIAGRSSHYCPTCQK